MRAWALLKTERPSRYWAMPVAVRAAGVEQARQRNVDKNRWPACQRGV